MNERRARIRLQRLSLPQTSQIQSNRASSQLHQSPTTHWSQRTQVEKIIWHQKPRAEEKRTSHVKCDISPLRLQAQTSEKNYYLSLENRKYGQNCGAILESLGPYGSL